MKQLNELLDKVNLPPSNLKKIKNIGKKVKDEVKNELLIQHNNLIEARYKLSLQEKRVILWLLTQIKPDDEDFKLHRLEVTEFCKMTGLEADNQYSKLQEVTLNLMKRALKIHKAQTKSVLQISWLSYAEYYLTKGYIELRFDPALKPYLLQLKNHFTKLSIADIMELHSIYSMRFYELLKQYESIGQREISIKYLREYCGIDKEEYKKYNNFKKDVLERAKKEINEKTDITVDYKEIKESRKIVKIEWTIRKKNIEVQEHLYKRTLLQKELRSQNAAVHILNASLG